jgi:MFS family permease
MPEASEVEPAPVEPVIRPTASRVALAGGLLAVELVAGIQTYLSQTVLPLMAADLGAQSLYGVVTATGAVANFAGLPLGLGLAARFRIPRLLIGFTLVISAGAIISAVAPSIWWFLLGTAVRGFASGCIATVSMGAVVTGLSGRVRQITLSAMSAMWVIAALFGPTYAAWISHVLNWRWALVLYLPVLLVARGIVARHLPEHERSEDAQVGWADAVLLALAMACIAAPVESEWLQMVLLVGGIVLLVVATRRVLPRGTFRLSSRRRAVIAFMFGLCGLYFAVDSVVAIVAHDVFGASAGDIGAVIMAGGLAWALVGLYCGWKPAAGISGYLRRASVGIGLIAVGVIGMSFAGRGWFGLAPIVTLAAGWALAGVGMGLCYVDTLNVLFTPPAESDGLSDLEVSGAAVMSESIAGIATMTTATAFLATSFGGGLDVGARSAVLLTVTGLAVLALFVPLVKLRGQD